MQTCTSRPRGEIVRGYFPLDPGMERVLHAAMKNFKRETQCKAASLRRLVGHITVLEFCETKYGPSSWGLPPSYNQSLSNTTSTRAPPDYSIASIDCTPATPNSDSTPRAVDGESAGSVSCDAEWSRGDGPRNDSKDTPRHALPAVISRPLRGARQQNGIGWTSNSTDHSERARLTRDVTGKSENEVLVVESIEEVTDPEY